MIGGAAKSTIQLCDPGCEVEGVLLKFRRLCDRQLPCGTITRMLGQKRLSLLNQPNRQQRFIMFGLSNKVKQVFTKHYQPNKSQTPYPKQDRVPLCFCGSCSSSWAHRCAQRGGLHSHRGKLLVEVKGGEDQQSQTEWVALYHQHH
ncbi:unnamed protein product [Polarella glacialis]|uniref:Uncharacterized protein n=1 Tax=Polarella glacialis TaxID=89957 RepID=A0A813JA42_POLGL|nr:unnamed protein product [Polarella glacialis]